MEKLDDSSQKFYKFLNYFSIFIVVFSALYAILPMLILRGDYCFTIHDGLDSYAGMTQLIHDKGLYFSNKPLPIMNGLESRYHLFTYNLYDFLNCVFGYIPGQICTRIIGVLLGFFSMRYLLHRIFREQNDMQGCIINLISIAYAITPCAPNRTIAFASLPAVVILFLVLSEKKQFSWLVLISVVVPVFSIFDAAMVFELGFWFVFAIVDWIKNKKLNKNLFIAFLIMCVSTIAVNFRFFDLALNANESTRQIYAATRKNGFFKPFKNYLLDGQYHAPSLHTNILMPFLCCATSFVFGYYCCKNETSAFEKNVRRQFVALFLLFGFWVLSAFVMAFQEAGFKTGFLLFDGFQWGRVIGFMRLCWYLIFATVLFLLPKKNWLYVFCYLAICFQLLNISINHNIYNDTTYSLKRVVWLKLYGKIKNANEISFNEFFSPKLFEEIKKDISYNNEGVAAYGYHPSVLMYNGFDTIDGYASVHSMEWQLKFREIIAPELEHNSFWQNYYDTWGGRMYLCGKLDSNPIVDKNISPAPLHINCEAFKKYGGKYILSRAQISNAEEIGLSFVKDYDRNDSLYHIWLYEAK